VRAPHPLIPTLRPRSDPPPPGAPFPPRRPPPQAPRAPPAPPVTTAAPAPSATRTSPAVRVPPERARAWLRRRRCPRLLPQRRAVRSSAALAPHRPRRSPAPPPLSFPQPPSRTSAPTAPPPAPPTPPAPTPTAATPAPASRASLTPAATARAARVRAGALAGRSRRRRRAGGGIMSAVLYLPKCGPNVEPLAAPSYPLLHAGPCPPLAPSPPPPRCHRQTSTSARRVPAPAPRRPTASTPTAATPAPARPASPAPASTAPVRAPRAGGPLAGGPHPATAAALLAWGPASKSATRPPHFTDLQLPRPRTRARALPAAGTRPSISAHPSRPPPLAPPPDSEPPTLTITGAGKVVVEAPANGSLAKAPFPAMAVDDNFEAEKVGGGLFSHPPGPRASPRFPAAPRPAARGRRRV
jgi:hypothetical protein